MIFKQHINYYVDPPSLFVQWQGERENRKWTYFTIARSFCCENDSEQYWQQWPTRFLTLDLWGQLFTPPLHLQLCH